MKTKLYRKETTPVRRLGGDRLARLAAVLAPVALFLPIAAVEGGWGEPVLFWWMCWTMIMIVYDNAKRTLHLCAESPHLEKLVRRASRKGAVVSLAVTVLIIVFILFFLHVPVPERIYEMPLFLLPFVFSISQDRLLRRLTKIEQL